MNFLLVPVIMGLAIGGTVGAIKIIRKFFPYTNKTMEKTEEWIEKHR